MRLKVAGLATDINDEAKNWISGIQTTGLNYKLLGVGQKFTGWKMRSRLYVEEMEKDTETDIYIFSDIYDVLINKDKALQIRDTSQLKKSGLSVEKYIIDTFLSFSKPIVFSAEMACWPKNCYMFGTLSMYHTFMRNHVFPNGGLVIGYKPYLIQLYKHLQNHPDDQYEVGRLSQMSDDIGIDSDSRLFYTYHARYDTDRMKKALFIHFPGMDFSPFSRIGYNRWGDKQNYSSVPYMEKKCPWVVMAVIIGSIVGLFLLYWIYLKKYKKRYDRM
jgi:hypothetical protein